MKKLGIFFILFFTSLLVALIAFNDHFIKGVFIISILSTSVFIPFGAALIVINADSSKRNKIKRIYLIICILLFVAGLTSRFLSFPGAGIELIVGVLWYCFAYAPLQLKHTYLKWLPFASNKWETVLLSTVDFIGLNAIALGVLFKIQHWPGANVLEVSGVIILLAGLLSWNFKFKKEVVRRKESEDKIKEQYNEIQDSLNYAKRIQSAILPSNKKFQESFTNAFVLYKPKDIVAGDFYWLEQKNDTLLVAAADCTGHGVPGAMVSVVCVNALNRAVREFNLNDPGKILDKTRELVIQEFEKSEEDVKDGMDIALCSLSGKTLKYAGAHNPLWIIRNGEIIETKANKQPIGKFHNLDNYTTHTFDLQKGDTIYIFSDGYVDQFGGDNGKKFKAKALKELLFSIQSQTMDAQKTIINTTFESWRGKMEQIDDVCVIGIRID